MYSSPPVIQGLSFFSLLPSTCSSLTWSTEQVSEQSRLYRDTLSWKTDKTKQSKKWFPHHFELSRKEFSIPESGVVPLSLVHPLELRMSLLSACLLPQLHLQYHFFLNPAFWLSYFLLYHPKWYLLLLFLISETFCSLYWLCKMTYFITNHLISIEFFLKGCLTLWKCPFGHCYWTVSSNQRTKG